MTTTHKILNNKLIESAVVEQEYSLDSLIAQEIDIKELIARYEQIIVEANTRLAEVVARKEKALELGAKTQVEIAAIEEQARIDALPKEEVEKAEEFDEGSSIRDAEEVAE